MKNYSLKILGNNDDFITVIGHEENGYVIKVVRTVQGKNKETIDFLSNEVFETCLKTGYLTEIKTPVMACTA